MVKFSSFKLTEFQHIPHTIRAYCYISTTRLIIQVYSYAEELHPTLYMGAHWRHLANTIKPSVCGGDAVLCQITLITCY